MIRDALDVARLGPVVWGISVIAAEWGLETDHLSLQHFVRRGRGMRAAETRELRERQEWET